MNVIFFGDIVGNRAADAVVHAIESIEEPTVVIANGENVSGGFGLSEPDCQKLLRGGVDLLSSGNHVWDKRDALSYASRVPMARPCNFAEGVPGQGHYLVSKHGRKVGLVNVMGRLFMSMTALDCPFRSCDRAVAELREAGAETIVVDVHAEATSEKAALAHYLEGRVEAVVGTHTHVPTADGRLLPRGTAFVTDIGACAVLDSIIGVNKESMLARFLNGMPSKPEVPTTGNIKLNAIRLRLDEQGRVSSLERPF